jgi:hypothetical protein
MQNKTSNSTSLATQMEATSNALLALTQLLLSQQSNSSHSSGASLLQVTTETIKAIVGLLQIPTTNNTVGRNNTSNSSYIAISISIPDSSSTLVLSLDSTATSAVLSVVQFDRNYLKSLANSQNSSSGSTSGNSAIDRILSDILSVKITLTNSSGGVKVSLPSFVANISVDSPSVPSSVTMFRHNCSMGKPEKVSFVCPESKVILNLTCSGLASANVRRKCPIPKQVCSLLNMNDLSVANDEYCQAEQSASGYLTCKCGFSTNGNSSAGAAAIIASGGAVNVAVMTEFVAGDFGTTVGIAGSVSSSAFAEQSSAVFVVFGVLWCVGLIMMGANYVTHADMKKFLRIAHKRSASLITMKEITELHESFRKYVIATMPTVYHPSSPWWIRLWKQFRQKHHYVRMIWHLLFPEAIVGEEEKQFQRQKAVLEVVEAMTLITISFFLLGLLYDLQYPTNDGSCLMHRDEASCLTRRSLLDPGLTVCKWMPERVLTAGMITEVQNGKVVQELEVNPDYLDDTLDAPCIFNDAEDSVLATFLPIVITSILSIPITSFLNMLFSLILARSRKAAVARKQASDALEAMQGGETSLAMIGNKEASRRRPVVVVESQRTQAESNIEGKTGLNSVSPALGRGRRTGVISLPSPNLANTPSPNVEPGANAPSSIVQGRRTGIMSLPSPNLASTTFANVEPGANAPPSIVRGRRTGMVSIAAFVDPSALSALAQSNARSSLTSIVPEPTRSGIEEVAGLSTLQARKQITKFRRKRLKDMEEEWEDDDSWLGHLHAWYMKHWSIVTTQEFPDHVRSSRKQFVETLGLGFTAPGPQGVSTANVNSISVLLSLQDYDPSATAKVDKEAKQLTTQLRYATDMEFGATLLHQLMGDILENISSPAAKRLYLFVVRKDFPVESSASSNMMRMLALLLVIAINLGALYYISLKGIQRGISWQLSFLRGCLLEWMFDVLVMDSIEVVWVDYFLPGLILREVHNALRRVFHLTEHVVFSMIPNETVHGNVELAEKRKKLTPIRPTALPSTSRLLAKEKTELPEAQLALLFYPQPNQAGSKSYKKQWERWRIVDQRFLLHYLSFLPLEVHFMLIRTVTTMLLGTLVFIWYYVSRLGIGNHVLLFLYVVICTAMFVSVFYISLRRQLRRSVAATESVLAMSADLLAPSCTPDQINPPNKDLRAKLTVRDQMIKWTDETKLSDDERSVNSSGSSSSLSSLAKSIKGSSSISAESLEQNSESRFSRQLSDWSLSSAGSRPLSVFSHRRSAKDSVVFKDDNSLLQNLPFPDYFFHHSLSNDSGDEIDLSLPSSNSIIWSEGGGDDDDASILLNDLVPNENGGLVLRKLFPLILTPPIIDYDDRFCITSQDLHLPLYSPINVSTASKDNLSLDKIDEVDKDDSDSLSTFPSNKDLNFCIPSSLNTVSRFPQVNNAELHDSAFVCRRRRSRTDCSDSV